jgi:SAM-dependent methyltransferase
MLGRKLVRPLEDDWQETLGSVARSRGWPTSHEVARLAERVAELSAAYNDPARARAAAHQAGAARLGFSFPRDVPKGAAAVRELVATGTLTCKPGRPLRLLDVGAGLGATTWGVARALDAAGGAGPIEATWVDTDAAALDLGAAIARERSGRAVALHVRTVTRTAGPFDDLPRFDLVLAGQLLSELDVGEDEPTRADRHATLLGSWLEGRVEPDGALVVIEPALRDRTRHLHRVRDLLAARGATVFAPCMHAAPCPALAREGDWCHEDIDVDLPAWLAPVARAAGLRREGLTFSYLVLRKDGARLADALGLPPGVTPLRVVSAAMPSKGKCEAFLCGELVRASGELVAARVRGARLGRDRTPANAAWDDIARGELVVADPALELDRPRIVRATRLGLAGEGESR